MGEMGDVISNVSTPTTQWSEAQTMWIYGAVEQWSSWCPTPSWCRSSKYEIGPHCCPPPQHCCWVSLPIFEGLCWPASLWRHWELEELLGHSQCQARGEISGNKNRGNLLVAGRPTVTTTWTYEHTPVNTRNFHIVWRQSKCIQKTDFQLRGSKSRVKSQIHYFKCKFTKNIPIFLIDAFP